jgi:hypothetical protein
MLTPSPSSRPSSFETCDQFFGITELLELFLQQCSLRVLLNCTLVCRTWSQIIRKSTVLQEHLFLQPAPAREGVKPTLNPMLAYFAPILVAKSTSEDITCNADYVHREDLTSLPWARDTSMDAPSRRAFARKEASWRLMLVSQPPTSRIDWWHKYTHRRSDDRDPRLASRDNSMYVSRHGWGHQYDIEDTVTLGMLWDLVESRMTRGCSALIQLFPNGMPVENDAHASEEEKQLIADNDPSRSPYMPYEPRVVLRTRHAWTEAKLGMGGVEKYPVLQESMTLSEAADAFTDGFNLLREDCQLDRRTGPRWAKSEGFWTVNLKGESSL